MILSHIKGFFKKNKIVLIYITLFFYLSFLFTDFSFAASWDLASSSSTAQSIAEWTNAFLGVVSLFTWLITALATMFLSPEWVNGSLFWMNEKFKTIWIMVSNIVYFIFAFLLIWIAFMNIIWKNTDQYQLKQALPKFIVWILIVPFTWFLVQFILSISAILTISAVSLPHDTFPDYKNWLDMVEIPKKCTIDISSKWWEKWIFDDCPIDWEKIELSKLLSIWNSSSAIYWTIAYYTHWVMWIENVDKIKFKDKSTIWTIADVAMKLIFDVLFLAIFFILLVALALVLMIRWIYIWIYMMLSPVFWLMYFFDKKNWWDWFFAKFNLKEFIALAMVPVYTMLALSFWMLFIYIVWTGLPQEATDAKNKNISTSVDDEWSAIIIWNGDNQISYTIKWATWTDWTIIETFAKLWNTSRDAIWALILKLFSIVVLWWSVMAAMRTSQITKTIVEPLHQFGTKVWQIATSAPWNIPVFGGQSMRSMDNIVWQVQWWISSNQSKKASSFLSKHPFLPWSNWVAKISKITQIRNWLNWKDDPKSLVKAVEEWMIEAWSSDMSRNLEVSRQLILDVLNKADLNKNKYDINDLQDINKFEDAINAIDWYANKHGIEFIPGKTWNSIVTDDIDKFIKKWKVSSTWWNNWPNNEMKFSINETVYNNILSKKEWILWEDAWVINNDEIKTLADLLLTQLKTNRMLWHFTEEELFDKIKTDLSITNKEVINWIINKIRTDNSDALKKKE